MKIKLVILGFLTVLGCIAFLGNKKSSPKHDSQYYLEKIKPYKVEQNKCFTLMRISDFRDSTWAIYFFPSCKENNLRPSLSGAVRIVNDSIVYIFSNSLRKEKIPSPFLDMIRALKPRYFYYTENRLFVGFENHQYMRREKLTDTLGLAESGYMKLDSMWFYRHSKD